MATALVTGASRGIGKAIAVSLAKAGFDVAVIARTLNEGEQHEHSSTVRYSDTSPLPGSLASTAALVEAEGVRSLVVQGDLGDRASVLAAAEAVLDAWGPVEVLVNNARYLGPGNRDGFADTPLELLDDCFEVNVLGPLALTQRLLGPMLERRSGCIVNITSSAAYEDPSALPGVGGWSLGYALTKGALHRVAGVLAVELGSKGIRAYSVQPGLILTERSTLEDDPHAAGRAPADVVGAVIAWLATDPSAFEPNGRNVEAQDAAREFGLLPGWP